MHAVNYVICGNIENNPRSSHYTGASHYRKNIVAFITQDTVIDDNLERELKTELCISERFIILAIGQKYSSIYPPSFFSIHRVIIFPNFPR